MRLSVAAQQTGGNILGDDVEFFSVSTDTRSLAPGDLFVALNGANFNGQDYLGLALEKGAVAAVVSRPEPCERPLLVVADTTRALGAMAQQWLAQYELKKVAITGSSGKTTVKEMLAAMLGEVAATLSTKGNLNNEIGVPLTLFRARETHRFAVIECGANHAGEIAYTAGLVQPDVALVNNIAPAHLEGFGSIEQVALAKAEIYDSLVSQGVAVINLDDQFSTLFQARNPHQRQLTFSLNNSAADVFAEAIEALASGGYRIHVNVSGKKFLIELPLLGLHNVRNALAACAVVSVFSIPVAAMQAGLAQVRPVAGRLCPVTDMPGYNIIDDTYNANPGSLRAAIDVLAEVGSDTCLVLGAMGELGAESEALHVSVGLYAAQKGIQRIYALGRNANWYRQGYEQGKPEGGLFQHFESHHQVADALLQQERDRRILIKGSRSAGMEKVILEMRNRYGLHEEQQ